MANYSVVSRLHTPLRLRIAATPQNPDPMQEVIVAGTALGSAMVGTLLGSTSTLVDQGFMDTWSVQSSSADLISAGLISWS